MSKNYFRQILTCKNAVKLAVNGVLTVQTNSLVEMTKSLVKIKKKQVSGLQQKVVDYHTNKLKIVKYKGQQDKKGKNLIIATQ